MANLRSLTLTSGSPSDTGSVATADTLMRLPVVAASAMARPANVTPYTANDAVANNATAGSVTPFSWTVSDQNDEAFLIERIRLASSDTGVIAKQFRMWMFAASPTPGAGDNTAFTVAMTNCIGTMSGIFKGYTDSLAVLIPDEGSRIITLPSTGAKTVFGLLQTLDDFTPSANSTTFTPTIEGVQGRA